MARCAPPFARPYLRLAYTNVTKMYLLLLRTGVKAVSAEVQLVQLPPLVSLSEGPDVNQDGRRAERSEP